MTCPAQPGPSYDGRCRVGHAVEMHVGALEVELHIAGAGSLKAKRAIVKHLVETSRQRFGVAASEVGHHDLWQRSTVGFAAVAPEAAHVERLLERTERFIWSHPEVEVIHASIHWMDLEQ